MEPRRFDSRSDRLSQPEGRETGRALVIEPHLRSRVMAGTVARGKAVSRSPDAKLEEAIGLARAIDLNVVSSGVVPLGGIRPATFIGKGKVEEIAGLIKADDAGIVVMDCALSPVQQRNLEKVWGAKVLDRTGLILEIFGRELSRPVRAREEQADKLFREIIEIADDASGDYVTTSDGTTSRPATARRSSITRTSNARVFGSMHASGQLLGSRRRNTATT